MKSKKAFFFTIDCILALIFISLLSILIFNYNIEINKVDLEETILSFKINDLLLTSKYLEINDLNTLERNYKKLVNNRCANLKINNNSKYTCKLNKIKDQEKTSNSINYINSSNKKIYVEIVIFY